MAVHKVIVMILFLFLPLNHEEGISEMVVYEGDSIFKSTNIIGVFTRYNWT